MTRTGEYQLFTAALQPVTQHFSATAVELSQRLGRHSDYYLVPPGQKWDMGTSLPHVPLFHVRVPRDPAALVRTRTALAAFLEHPGVSVKAGQLQHLRDVESFSLDQAIEFGNGRHAPLALCDVTVLTIADTPDQGMAKIQDELRANLDGVLGDWRVTPTATRQVPHHIKLAMQLLPGPMPREPELPPLVFAESILMRPIIGDVGVRGQMRRFSRRAMDLHEMLTPP